VHPETLADSSGRGTRVAPRLVMSPPTCTFKTGWRWSIWVAKRRRLKRRSRPSRRKHRAGWVLGRVQRARGRPGLSPARDSRTRHSLSWSTCSRSLLSVARVAAHRSRVEAAPRQPAVSEAGRGAVPAVSDFPSELRLALADRLRDRARARPRRHGHGLSGEDLRHDRPVAFKVLHPDLAATLGPERFQREIRMAARLQHPHILTVLDSGEAAGRLWFTMPFIQGESLRDRLNREKQLPVEDALRIAREAAMRSTMPTRRASSIGTSSRRTSC